jgi:hypothetical protein
VAKKGIVVNKKLTSFGRPSGDRMAEIVEDSNGEKLAFSNLAIGSVKLASVASSSISKELA